MPHYVVEYARELENELDLTALLQAIHQGAVASGLFDEANIKTRAIAYDHYRVAGRCEPFIHLTASILDGRTREQKQHLVSTLKTALLPFVDRCRSLTIDVRDMQSDCYGKLSI